MTPSRKPIAPQKELTEEQKKEMRLQALHQKRAALIEGFAFNLSQNPMVDHHLHPNEDIVDLAIRLADKTMEKAYGVKISE